MKIAKTDIIQSENVYIPQGTYRVRCVKADFVKENSKKNPMTTLSLEIIEPEKIMVDGSEFSIAGRTFKMFLIHVVEVTKGRNESPQAEVYRFMDKLGLTSAMETDENNQPVWDSDHTNDYFLGMEFDIALESQENIKRFRADKAAGEKVGKPMLDGEGKEIKEGWQITAFPNQVLPHCNPVRNERVAF